MATKEVTLDTLFNEIALVNKRLVELLNQQGNIEDTLDDLVAKVDEINLPTGDGFERGFES